MKSVGLRSRVRGLASGSDDTVVGGRQAVAAKGLAAEPGYLPMPKGAPNLSQVPVSPGCSSSRRTAARLFRLAWV